MTKEENHGDLLQAKIDECRDTLMKAVSDAGNDGGVVVMAVEVQKGTGEQGQDRIAYHLGADIPAHLTNVVTEVISKHVQQNVQITVQNRLNEELQKPEVVEMLQQGTPLNVIQQITENVTKDVANTLRITT